MKASPSAPLCEMNPTFPGSGMPRGKGRVQSHAGGSVDDAEAVGPDQSHTALAADLEQLALKLGSLRSHLGEPGRDHDHGRDPPARTLPDDVDHGRRRDGDHREVDRSRDLTDAAVGPHRLHDVGFPVHGIGGAFEARIEEVVEDLAADRVPLPRRPDDGDGPRRDEVAHRGGGGASISILEPLHRL